MAEEKTTKTAPKSAAKTTTKTTTAKKTTVKAAPKTTTKTTASATKEKVAVKKLEKEQAQVLGKETPKMAFAISKNVRIAPRKVRLVIDLIRGEDVKRAKAILEFTRRRASQPILDCLKSAIANAVNNNNLHEDKLYVSQCFVNEGRTIKRMLPRARGSADTIQKRSSHIKIYVSERN